MKVSSGLLVGLTGLWLQITSIAALPWSKNQSDYEDHPIHRILIPRTEPFAADVEFQHLTEPPNDYNWYSTPFFAKTHLTPGLQTISDDDMRTLARDSYDSAVQQYQNRYAVHDPHEKPNPALWKGADLVAVLFVPNQGYTSAIKPKGGMIQYMAANMKTMAPALEHGIHVGDGRKCAEDAAIFMYEKNKDTEKLHSGQKFPDGTKMAAYGRKNMGARAGNLDGVPDWVDPCQSKCEKTLANLNITPVPLPKTQHH